MNQCFFTLAHLNDKKCLHLVGKLTYIATYFADNALGEETRNVLNFRGLPFLQPDQLPHGGYDHLQAGSLSTK